MSDYQVTNYGCCGECKHHTTQGKGWYCENEDSDYYMDFTDYTDTCEEWEQRGVD